MRRSLFVLTLGTALCGAVSAQENTKLWTTDLELGYVSTAGNSDTSSLKVRADTKREGDVWRYIAHFDALNTEEDGSRSAEKYFFSNKLDYKISARSYVFGYASYEEDRFSGYDWQAVGAAGYGYRILENDTMTWDLEAGPGYRVSNVSDNTLSDNEHEVILRAYTKYEWRLTENATFEQELGAESGGDKTVTRSVTSLKSTIIGALAMKLSYSVRYTDNVPPGTEHTDTETAVTLVYSF
jgi:putative salt-induced outer membrane protein